MHGNYSIVCHNFRQLNYRYYAKEKMYANAAQ